MLTKENGFSFPWRFPISVDREISFALVTLLVTPAARLLEQLSRESGTSTTFTRSSTTRTIA